MIHSKMGHGSEAPGYLKASLRNKYPVVYETFKKELEYRSVLLSVPFYRTSRM